MTTETYTIRLLFSIKDTLPVRIPGFATRNAAHMAGMFLQMAHDRIVLFEVDEIRENVEAPTPEPDRRDLYEDIDVIDAGLDELDGKRKDKQLHGLLFGSWQAVKPAIIAYIRQQARMADLKSREVR